MKREHQFEQIVNPITGVKQLQCVNCGDWAHSPHIECHTKGTEMNHTPGPWKVGKAHTDVIYCDNQMTRIAFCYADTVDNYEANAKLIAAAPDLLEACRAMVDVSREQNLNSLAMRVDKARLLVEAAIAKATD